MGRCAVNIKLITAVAASAAFLTACSGIAGTLPAVSAAPAGNGSAVAGSQAGGGSGRSAGNADSGDCLLGANGADIEVGIANPTVSCARWIQDLAGTGLAWYPVSQLVLPGSPGGADGETMQEACDLTDGTQELYAEDAGGQSYADSICSQEEQNGWAPEGTPGPIAAQAQQQARQQAQAQASQSAAAAQASTDAAARQQAQNALSTLQGLSLAPDLGKLSADLTHTSKDLAAEKAAAAAGPNADGGNCYNLTANVDYDARSNVAYDAQADFGYDLQYNLVPDIASGRQDVTALQSALSDLQNLGQPAPPGAQPAITTAQNAISNAVTTANADTSQENGYVTQAYQVASGIATGNCAGDGPGSTPSPIQGIS